MFAPPTTFSPRKCLSIECCNRKVGGTQLQQQMAASCSGAIVTSLFMTPLDVVKIRLQNQQLTRAGTNTIYLNGTTDAIFKIAKFEGVKVLWSGMAPAMGLVFPAILFYSIYDNLQLFLKQKLCNRRRINPDNYSPPNWMAAALAGSTARTISLSIISPIDIIRTKMQSQHLTYKEVGVLIQRSMATKGISSFYLGWTATLLRDIPYSGVYWAGYDYIKTHLMKNKTQHETPFFVAFTSGAVSSCIASVFTHPFDVIKTNREVKIGGTIQEMNKSIATVAKEIYQLHGMSGFSAGLVPRIALIVPQSAIMIGFYEYFKHLFQNMH